MKHGIRFEDRVDAGHQLAQALLVFTGRDDVLLYALPRGGVVTAAEVARVLHLPFDVLVTRKIGAPYNAEYAIGAIAETGEAVWNEGERLAADAKALREVIAREQHEMQRRIKKYRNAKPLPSFQGKTVVIIDDGIATGLTARAAIAAARHQQAARVIIAVPHGAKETLDALRADGDEVIAVCEPDAYTSVGAYYNHFPEVRDEEVNALLTTYGHVSSVHRVS